MERVLSETRTGGRVSLSLCGALCALALSIQGAAAGEADFLPPTVVECTAAAMDGRLDVTIVWQNEDDYDELWVRRNGMPLEPQPGPDDTMYVELGAPAGIHRYDVVARIGADTALGTCPDLVPAFIIPGGAAISKPFVANANLGPVDFENGIANVREGFEDGANEAVFCGGDDVRDARVNLGDATTPASSFFYFAALDPELQALDEALLAVVLFDSSDLVGTELFIQYTTGASEILSALTEPQVLLGLNEWRALFFEMHGTAFRGEGTDFRVFAGPAQICVDEVAIFDNTPRELDIPTFHRGDANGDGVVDISDALTKLLYLFLLDSEPPCLDAVDIDDDGHMSTTGVILLLEYLFLGGERPADPGPAPQECGPDPTRDFFPRCEYAACG